MFEGIGYDLAKIAFIDFAATLGLTFLFARVFKIMQGWKDTVYFVVVVGGVIGLGLYLFAPQTTMPKLAGNIQSIVVGDIENSHDSIAIFNVSIMNAGTMPSITKQWNVNVRTGDVTYQGSFINQPPKKFTMKALPIAQPDSPLAVVYDSQDNMLSKIDPIQSGGLQTGIFYVIFKDIPSSAFKNGAEYNLSFEDVLSNKYLMRLRSTAKIGAFNALTPGLHSELVCPIPQKKASLPLDNASPRPLVLPLPAN